MGWRGPWYMITVHDLEGISKHLYFVLVIIIHDLKGISKHLYYVLGKVPLQSSESGAKAVTMSLQVGGETLSSAECKSDVILLTVIH